jgi:ribonuclease BN (tRNA processing enzyme)
VKLRLVLFVSALTLLRWAVANCQEPVNQEQKSRPPQTRVVLLGTGTPVPDPDRSGPATAIVVGDSAYLVDFGPGVVRRAEAAVLDRGITALEPGNLKVAFVTHLHSDHTAGYSDLIFTGWTSGRSTQLEVYGPTGLKPMIEHCDVLIHDAQTLDLYAKMPERLHSFVTKYHTTTAHLAALATEAKPKLLVMYHTVAFRPGIAPPKFLSSITATGASRSTEEILQEEIGARYSGQFVIGHDLDVY